MKNFIICILSIAVVCLAYENFKINNICRPKPKPVKKIYSYSPKVDPKAPAYNKAGTPNRSSLRQVEGSLKKTF